jgi:hypothetical protein
MNLQQRIDLLVELGRYMNSDEESWLIAKEKAHAENNWFIPEFMEHALTNITSSFLDRAKLNAWVSEHGVPNEGTSPRTIGIIMAGNIPLAGFHDFMSTFVAGQRQVIKPSSKDQSLIKAIAGHLAELEPASQDYVSFAEMLKGCDAYIATGNNNSARYFDYYFQKYPHIIRHNRTSVAILTGEETREELDRLGDDICLYFGLGCRNVTKIYVPPKYDFEPLLQSLEKFRYLEQLNKYKNNFDYQLSLLILNNQYYMSNGFMLLTEHSSPFSPIGALHFEYCADPLQIREELASNPRIQCIIGRGNTAFGTAQHPSISDYADGIDTLDFLMKCFAGGRERLPG